MTRADAETLPASLYREASTYEDERRKIFGTSWLFMGHESQLAEAGDYVAATLAGYPLIAVRGKDGVIRAFHNVCRHRAGPLADDGEGKCRDFITCRYHGWRYSLDGRLASARDFGPAKDFDPREFGLIGVECATWRGFVFVSMKPAMSLEKQIAPLEAALADTAFDDLVFARTTAHPIGCNWKTYAENYLEGYHIPLVHPGLNAAVDAANYSVEVEGDLAFHRAPPRDGAPVAGFWAMLWPCLAVNVYPEGVMMERMSPIGHEKTQLDYVYFFKRGTPTDEIERSIAASETTTVEDVMITEAVQRNLNAGIYETGRLSPKHEGAVAWFQSAVARALQLNSAR